MKIQHNMYKLKYLLLSSLNEELNLLGDFFQFFFCDILISVYQRHCTSNGEEVLLSILNLKVKGVTLCSFLNICVLYKYDTDLFFIFVRLLLIVINTNICRKLAGGSETTDNCYFSF